MGDSLPILAKAPDPPAIPWVDGTYLFITVTLLGIVAATWVYLDARSRGIDNPALWAVVVAFLFLLYAVPGTAALVIYVLLRDRRGDDETGSQPTESSTVERDGPPRNP